MSAALSLQITIFILVFTGFLIRKIELVSSEGQKSLTNLVIYLTIPCSTVDAFSKGGGKENLKSYYSIFLIAIGIQAISVIYGKIIYRKEPEGHR